MDSQSPESPKSRGAGEANLSDAGSGHESKKAPRLQWTPGAIVIRIIGVGIIAALVYGFIMANN